MIDSLEAVRSNLEWFDSNVKTPRTLELERRIIALETVRSEAQNVIDMARSFQSFPSWLLDLETSLTAAQSEKEISS